MVWLVKCCGCMCILPVEVHSCPKPSGGLQVNWDAVLHQSVVGYLQR